MSKINPSNALSQKTDDNQSTPYPGNMEDWATYIASTLMRDMGDYLLTDAKVQNAEHINTQDGHQITLEFSNTEDRDTVFQALGRVPNEEYENLFRGSLRIEPVGTILIIKITDIYDFANLAQLAVTNNMNIEAQKTEEIKNLEDVKDTHLGIIPANRHFGTSEDYINIFNKIVKNDGYTHAFSDFSFRPIELVHIINACHRAENKFIPAYLSSYVT